MFKCPSFNETKFRDVAARPDCDGAGILPWFPVKQQYANYGIGFGVNSGAGYCGRQDAPGYYFPGTRLITLRPPSYVTMALAQIQRPADSAIVTDGFTGIINSGGIGTTMGCEAADSHNGGGTIIYTDGHAKWLARNIERYLEKDANNCFYMKYLSIDK
jgi:prepilin-type processing-associated H-X9-DG protein